MIAYALYGALYYTLCYFTYMGLYIIRCAMFPVTTWDNICISLIAVTKLEVLLLKIKVINVYLFLLYFIVHLLLKPKLLPKKTDYSQENLTK